MTSSKDYYKILGVNRQAPPEEIKTKFRKLALEYHPDRNRDPSAQEKFKEINSAYQVLSDPQKRAQYDRFGDVGIGSGRWNSGFEGSETFGGFGDIFDAFFGGFGGRAQNVPSNGRDIQTAIKISFEESVFGINKEIEIERIEPCGTCKGIGSEPGYIPIDCTQCNGSGQIRRIQRSIFGQFSQSGPCDKCKGKGQLITNPCTKCKGSSRERKNRRIKVEIPAGVENGMQVRLTQQGDAGSNGGLPGNLYVGLRVEKHNMFYRKDYDVILDIPINFAQAALGDEFEVPTLQGSEKLRIPPGTQSGTQFRIKGIGIPYISKDRKGDQLVIVHVMTPAKLSTDQKNLFGELSKTLGQQSKEDKKLFDNIRNTSNEEI